MTFNQLVSPPSNGYPEENSLIIRRIDFWSAGQVLMLEDLSIYNLNPRDSYFGLEGSFKVSGNLITFWTRSLTQQDYLFWLLGAVGEDLPAAWLQQLVDYAWWACGSGSGSFILHMPPYIYEAFVARSQPAKLNSSMVGPLDDIMRSKPVS